MVGPTCSDAFPSAFECARRHVCMVSLSWTAPSHHSQVGSCHSSNQRALSKGPPVPVVKLLCMLVRLPCA